MALLPKQHLFITGRAGAFQYPRSDRWLCYQSSISLLLVVQVPFSILARIDGSVTKAASLYYWSCRCLSVSSLGSMALLPKQHLFITGRAGAFQYPRSDRWLSNSSGLMMEMDISKPFSILARIDSSVAV